MAMTIDTEQAEAQFHGDTKYPGDLIDLTAGPVKSKFEKMDFANPALMLAFFDERIRTKQVILYKWQLDIHEFLGSQKPTALAPLKYCLVAANGSGKDAFIAAPLAVWFCLCKIQSRVIITSSSGTQLTSQTEPAIRMLCETINATMGMEIFRIRQRYIKCRLSGSEIRMFATDEAGKAEGYHPIVPNAEMMIMINEWKSVDAEITNALRRCTGFNYWFGYSSPGEPVGPLYKAATSWRNVRYVTSEDCPMHLSEAERKEDEIEWGMHSALFRSKHLAQFTSIGGEVIITQELVDKLRNAPPQFSVVGWPDRVGIDLAAGGDETCCIRVNGLSVRTEYAFRETDTTVAADKIEQWLLNEKIEKTHEYIFADDGGVGHAIIDMLVRRGWNIKRILNQSAAINKRGFGNRGAENWFRVKRIFEEGFFDISSISAKCIEQLINRKYKQGLIGARILLESKKEAKANGRPSPDRADALILAYTGLTIDDFIKAKTVDKPVAPKGSQRHLEKQFNTLQAAQEDYENRVTYGNLDNQKKGNRRIFGSLSAVSRN